MLQINIREEYRITTLEVVKLIEDLINAQTPPVFREAAAAIIRYIIVTKLQHFGNKVKTENSYNTLTLTLSKTFSFVVSNRSIALITNKFSVALLTKLAILNNANVALVDAVHYSIVIDALMITLIKDDDDLLGTVNSYIKLRRLRARCKTEAADSRYAKVSRGRTKKDKDLEDSNTSSDVLRLRRRDRAAASQLKKTRDEEELAKAKKEKEEKEAQERKTYSLDINPKDNSEDEEATIVKDLAREQKERLKALLNANRDGNRTLHSRRLTDAYILYFKELLSNNSRIFANAIGIGKTQAIIEVQNAQAESDAIEHNAVNDNNKLCPTKGERTFYCACKRSPFFNAEPRQAAIIITTLQFCFFSNSPPENIGRLTKEEVIEMRINTTNAISKALAAANKLIILEANTPAMHSKATKHRLALLAARFVIVCSFRKVDKYVFRAYNTISVTAQRMIIRKGGSYIEKRVILLPNILKKEGLNELEASRRVIFNCFKMQAIFKIYSSCKVKRFTLNSVKDLFTNLSKDYFLVREAHAITKSSLNIAAEDAAKAANTLLLLKKVCAKILIGSYKLIIIVALIAFAEAIILTEATHVVIIEPQDSIVYFNLDSELELKVLGKQDVKTTS
ncbi:hypothetical protein HBI25_000320 [Parastagonospora nodorum]|nr:hypothetical protein HBI25_000320 [Parastagonospora nodorum]